MIHFLERCSYQKFGKCQLWVLTRVNLGTLGNLVRESENDVSSGKKIISFDEIFKAYQEVPLVKE